MNSMTEPTNSGDRIKDSCPAWCTADHAQDDARDDLVLHLGDDRADGVVRGLLDAHRLDIRVARCDGDDSAGRPNLMVHIDAELTTWEQAAELARTILDGFGYVPREDEQDA